MAADGRRTAYASGLHENRAPFGIRGAPA